MLRSFALCPSLSMTLSCIPWMAGVIKSEAFPPLSWRRASLLIAPPDAF